MRAAYLGRRRGIVRAVRWAQRRIDVRPTVGGAGAVGCCLATRRSVVTARARGPLGRGPSRARGNAVGCGRYRLQGQLRCKSTNEPVHSNIFPLRY